MLGERTAVSADDGRNIQKRRTVQVTHTTTTTTTNTRNGQVASSSSAVAEGGDHFPVYSQDRVDATELVDNLLRYTQSLMKNATDNPPTENNHMHHIIAFSGGIDSSVVTALVHEVSSSLSCSPPVKAVLGLSPAVPTDQIRLAEQVAAHIGVHLEQIPTTEGNDEMYIANDGRACLACKTHLYTCLSSIANHYHKNSSDDTVVHDYNGDARIPQMGGKNNTVSSIHFQLYNGTNADDLKDPTRLGLIAADQFHVQSPLKFTPKALVRVVGRHLGLPNWDYAASPCLRSRLALGVQALPQHLERIERAEAFVRQALALDPTRNMRVRLLSGNKAMIEVEDRDLQHAQECLHQDDTWRDYFVQELEFNSVDVRKFKTGSVAQKDQTLCSNHMKNKPSKAKK